MQLTQKTLVAVLIGVILMITWVGIALAGSTPPPSNTGEQVFKSKCAACHSIGGGKLVGPDLQGVTDRRSGEWLAAFIRSPKALIDSGDETANQLVQEHTGMVMPTLGLTDAETSAVIQFLTAPTTQTANAAAVTGDPVHGEQLFSGQTSLANGGTACIACHTVQGVGQLGGGTLGPDLTHVAARYGGPTGMSATLSGLPFPTMQGIFANRTLTPGEQADLLAFFIAADQKPVNRFTVTTLVFIGVGVLGVGILFVAMLRFWPKQRVSLSEKIRQST